MYRGPGGRKEDDRGSRSRFSMQDRKMEGERMMGREDALSEMMQRSGGDDREFAKYLRSLDVRIPLIEAQLERDK